MKKIFTLLSIAALTSATFAQEFNEIKVLKAQGLNETTVIASDNNATAQDYSLIQYKDGTTFENSLISCSGAGQTVQNTWSRFFDLKAEFGIDSEFTVKSVTVGGRAMSTNNTIEVAFSQFAGAYTFANITAGMGSGYASHAFPTAFELAEIQLEDPQEAIKVGNKLAVAISSELESDGTYLTGGVMVGNNKKGETKPSYLGWPGSQCVSGGTSTAPTNLTSYGSAYVFHVTGSTASLGTVELGSNKLAVYPNPATTEVNVQLKDTKVANVEVADVTGRVIPVKFSKEGKVDTSKLSAGVYFLRVKDDKGVTRIQKFIKK
ncbi:Por secretion system C-terminal sorting domain-containing protein [Algoriella xinjiangensis]|uniref:Por secretion system C-terminal sorting domain-containing protein n=1 Tax=Algoriella xinjiangensis TaxID=684065 RepID=A0A1I4YE19_9FLAO|nr:T9SS type A sorting domain-containing protein [Algoriella xinjiangensis]SFN36274.1 Por secretion system C-terminal sorting domain-containing protein [Algoriella xinjiangensis]VDH17297.1 Por secretion system C-terminal sorting domain [Algoriella xinjiangensis]